MQRRRSRRLQQRVFGCRAGEPHAKWASAIRTAYGDLSAARREFPPPPIATQAHCRSFAGMRDTSTEAATAQIAAFRRLSPAERVALAFEASEWIKAVARARTSALPAAPAAAGAPLADAPPTLREPPTR